MASGDRHQRAAAKPAFGEEEVAELVDEVFGLKAVWVGPLPSYDDQNFHVRVSSGGEAEGAEEYVLKITNSEDSRQPALIEAQTQAMVFLSTHGFPSATPRPTKDGSIMSLWAGERLQDLAWRECERLVAAQASASLLDPALLRWHKRGVMLGTCERAQASCRRRVISQALQLWHFL